MNINLFLLVKDASEWTLHSSEDMLLVKITYRWLEKVLQLLDFLELGCLFVPMKMYPVHEECLTGMLDNIGRMSTTNKSLYRQAFGDNTLRFPSHEESYIIVLANWIFRHSNFLNKGYILDPYWLYK
jgi:hypothetical protein